ncbi:Bifunctional polymyxin resistance protein ArnA [termite gut metagenome]|uniref:Bifunctional polymyxin resistance protein ArnA n=1 Tax=termite gut metagenome TaxID=433724 RepID=A0A5J4RYK0_9ZZZZ
MKKQILITGGVGFIGSHLCERLLKEDNKVICLDNYSTGSEENIAHLLSSTDFNFIRHDVIIPFSVEADEIYHLACPASPVAYQSNPIQTTKTAVVGTINALELAKRMKAKILLASTSEVYGDPLQHPQKESYWGNVNPVGIRSCYDEGKRCAETLCMDYHREENIQTKIIRIFNTYGSRMKSDDGRVISNFIGQAIKNKDITIYGNGQQTRSFQYVDDLIDAMLKVMATSDDVCMPINIGNPEEFTILELARQIIELTHSQSKIIFKPLPNDDPKHRKPDIALAKVLLQWQPKIQLREGLERTVETIRLQE